MWAAQLRYNKTQKRPGGGHIAGQVARDDASAGNEVRKKKVSCLRRTSPFTENDFLVISEVRRYPTRGGSGLRTPAGGAHGSRGLTGRQCVAGPHSLTCTVFRWWKEAGENPHKHEQNRQTPHTEITAGIQTWTFSLRR